MNNCGADPGSIPGSRQGPGEDGHSRASLRPHDCSQASKRALGRESYSSNPKISLIPLEVLLSTGMAVPSSPALSLPLAVISQCLTLLPICLPDPSPSGMFSHPAQPGTGTGNSKVLRSELCTAAQTSPAAPLKHPPLTWAPEAAPRLSP